VCLEQILPHCRPYLSTTIRKHAALVSEPVSSSISRTAEGLPTALNMAGHREASVLRDTDTTTSAAQPQDRHQTTGATATLALRFEGNTCRNERITVVMATCTTLP
jgi:hypothetical protein